MKPIVYISYHKEIPETPVKYSQKSLSIITEMVKDALYAVCDFASLVKGKSVFMKPNLVRPNPHEIPGITTDPRVLIALIRLSKEAGAVRVMVGENPGYKLPSETAFELSEMQEDLEKAGAEIIYLDKDEIVRVANPDGRILREMSLPKTVLEADFFINVPKMKTHMHTLATLGIKNLHGLLFDEERLMFHRNDISYKVVDIYRAIPPHLTVIDGIWAMDGQAPLSGSTIKDMNVIITGQDIVATDSVACETMMIAPEEVDTNRIAHWEGFGEMDLNNIDIKGAKISEVQRRFRRPVLSAAGIFENILAIESGTCRGCLSAMRHALDKMDRDGLLTQLPPLTFFVGIPMPNTPNLQNPAGDVWVFGNCAVNVLQQEHVRNANPHVIYGCAPHIHDLYKELKKVYLTDSVESMVNK